MYKVYMDSYVALDGSCFMVSWIIFKHHLLWGRSNTEPGDHDTPNAHNRWFILFYHAWGPAWIEIIGLAFGWGPVTYDFTLYLKVRDHTTWFWRCLGMAIGHFVLGSHNFIVTALGSCVKWPIGVQCMLKIDSNW